MKNKETYVLINNKWIKATKWILFKRTIRNWIDRFKIIDTQKYRLILNDDAKYYFKLSSKEYEDAERIYKDKGTISYEFYPAGGIGWGVRIRVLNTDEVIDISDIESW